MWHPSGAARTSARSPRWAAGLVAIAAATACGGSPSADQPDAAGSATPDAALPAGPAARIPEVTGTCPALATGDVTFAPAGMPPRRVKLVMPSAADQAPGPLVLYWHATGSSPAEAAYSLGTTQAAIVAAGGVVAAPYADPAAGQFEWFLVNQSPKQDDFLLADEVVACLVAAHRVDPAHVHSMGMSAGALQTTAVSFLRASYVASVTTYSGGMPPGFTVPNQDPTNKFAALIFDGGPTDNVFNVDFQAASERYRTTLMADGHFTAICNHGGGHSIPRDAAPSVWAFFQANGFGVSPSPYESGLPASFPAYCSL